MKIGGVTVGGVATLAPMEEHTHYYFRRLMKRFGAAWTCSERVDSAALARRDRRALRVLYTAPDEAPRAAQTSGADPAVMAQSARVVEELGYNAVDLNFDCPIRRLADRGEAGVLTADPAAIERITAAVVRAVTIPVTLKIRSGPDAEHETAPEIARRAEAVGAAAVTVHARSVQQAYQGEPDWNVIRRVKAAVAIPVLGSGGIRQAADAMRMLRETGADAAAIGRGCLGNPWIFREARALASGARAVAPPSPQERARVLLELVDDEFRFYGASVALRRLPRTACYFAKFLPGFDVFRQRVKEVKNPAQFRALVREVFR